MTVEVGVKVGVGVVVLRGDEVLLIKRGKAPRFGEWTIPGGRQWWGETLRETAVREVREETGVEIALGDLIDVIDLIGRDDQGTVSYHLTLVDFAADYVSGTVTAGDDAADARFVPLTGLAPYDLWGETLKVIETAASRRLA